MSETINVPVLVRRRPRILGDKPGKHPQRGNKNASLGLSPRGYEKRRLMLKVFELAAMQTPLKEIAVIVEKSVWWVEQALSQIQNDFSGLIQSKEAKRIIDDNLAKFDLAAQKALELLKVPGKAFSGKSIPSEGGPILEPADRIKAIKTYAGILKLKAEYEVLVGRVKRAPTDLNLRGFLDQNAKENLDQNLEEIQGEISAEDTDKILLTIADSIREGQSTPNLEAETAA